MLFININMQEDIHEKLDQMLVEYNKMLDQYQDLRSQLGEAMKNGFWNLSRARSALPVGSITEKRYPPTIEPTTTIELGNDKASSYTTLSIKQRPAPSIPIDTKEVTDDNKSEKKKSKKPLDPTQWFAYLPSPALKQSQTNFNNAVKTIAQLANISVKLETLADEYSALLEKSKQM